MGKGYLRFILATITWCTMLSALSFFAVFYFLDIGLDSEMSGYLFPQIVLYVTALISCMVLTIGLFSFSVIINADSIKAGLPPKKIEWQDVEAIKIVGVPRIKSLNRMIVKSQRGQSLEVNLFIYKNQNAFVKELISYVPWASGLVVDNLPSEVTKNNKG